MDESFTITYNIPELCSYIQLVSGESAVGEDRPCRLSQLYRNILAYLARSCKYLS